VYGLLSGSFVFLEPKSRRAELALYVFPKALSFYFISCQRRGWVGKLPHGFETLMFSVGMGFLVSYYQSKPECLSSMVSRGLSWVDGLIDDSKTKEYEKQKMASR
jgi:hypothetical protein